MSLFHRLFAPKPDPRETMRPLWNAVVAEARRSDWYARGGVADTVPGRFDMVCAVLAAMLLRMGERESLAQPAVWLTELFVHDMDGQLRELGIGDIVVGKHVGKLVGAMGGRIEAYRAGLAGDEPALAEAVARNVNLCEGSDPAIVASELRALAERLGRTGDEALLAGELAT